MEFTQIIKDLKAKKYQPVYFLYGEEEFYIDRISDFIEDKVLDEAEKEFNQTVLYDFCVLVFPQQRKTVFLGNQIGQSHTFKKMLVCFSIDRMIG